jgi:hypothetical protein
MILAIEHNNATVALARNEDVVECHDEDTADALRAKGYVYLGNTSRPATDVEQARYCEWLAAGRAS